MTHALDRLFQPESVAIIGASDNPGRIGGRPLRYLLQAGFKGALYPVNPGRATVQGVPAYADIAQIDGPIDLAIVIVPADQVVASVEACARKGVRSLVIFSAGFAEVGHEGAERQQRIAAIAAGAGMRVLGPNCLGLFNAWSGFFGTFTQAFDQGLMQPGPLGIVSQSGAAGAHLAYLCKQRGLGVGHWITTGNESDIDIAECIEWMAQAQEVQAIAVFAEAVRQGPKFVQALEAARRRRKPVLLLKVGRSQAGARAAASHTGALVGEDGVFDAVLRQYGAHRVHSIDELLDLSCACVQGRLPASRQLGIVTTSGGLGILAADVAADCGLEVGALPPQVQDKVKALIPFAGTGNPIDVTAQGVNDPQLIAGCIELALAEGHYGSLVCFLTSAPAVPSIGAPLLQALRELRRRYPQLPIALEMAVPREVAVPYEAAGFLVYEDLNRAVRVLSSLASIRAGFDRPAPAALPAPVDAAIAPDLDEFDAKQLLRAAGVPAPEERIAQDGAEAADAAQAIGFPVALKIVSPDIAHKTEIGGVVLNVASAAQARQQAEQMLARVRAARPDARVRGILVAPMRSGGVEMICGVVADPVFGPVVMLGLGGIHAEVLRDVSFRLAPFDADEALCMVDELRGAALLRGARGAPAADIAALTRAVAALSTFAARHRHQIAEIDINPLKVFDAGQGVLALDALIVPRVHHE